MRTHISILTVGLALLLTGCTDRQAQEYAGKINAILQNYIAQINHNIDSEQLAYEKLAAVYETEKQRDVFESLNLERMSRSIALSGALAEGRIPISAVAGELEKYVIEDLARTRKIYADEMDASSAYLTVLDSLQAQTAKAADLSKILEDLAQPVGLLKRGEALASWGREFQKQNAIQGCLQIQTAADIAQTNADRAKADAAKAAQDKADTLKNELQQHPNFTDGKCQ